MAKVERDIYILTQIFRVLIIDMVMKIGRIILKFFLLFSSNILEEIPLCPYDCWENFLLGKKQL